MLIKIKDLPGSLVAVMDDDGTVIINAKFRQLIDEIFFDDEGLIKEPLDYHAALQDYYS